MEKKLTNDQKNGYLCGESVYDCIAFKSTMEDCRGNCVMKKEEKTKTTHSLLTIYPRRGRGDRSRAEFDGKKIGYKKGLTLASGLSPFKVLDGVIYYKITNTQK